MLRTLQDLNGKAGSVLGVWGCRAAHLHVRRLRPQEEQVRSRFLVVGFGGLGVEGFRGLGFRV